MKEDEKKETRKDVLLRIQDNLKSIFMEANAISENIALKVVECLKDLEMLTGSSVKEHSVSKRSKDFANAHKDFCMKMGDKFKERNLSYFIHLSDPLGKNTISFGEMEEDLLIKSITGALIQSRIMFQGVLKELGMPPNCLECMDAVPDRLKHGYNNPYESDQMPERLKHILQRELGGVLIGLGKVKLRPSFDDDKEDEDKPEDKGGNE